MEFDDILEYLQINKKNIIKKLENKEKILISTAKNGFTLYSEKIKKIEV